MTFLLTSLLTIPGILQLTNTSLQASLIFETDLYLQGVRNTAIIRRKLVRVPKLHIQLNFYSEIMSAHALLISSLQCICSGLHGAFKLCQNASFSEPHSEMLGNHPRIKNTKMNY